MELRTKINETAGKKSYRIFAIERNGDGHPEEMEILRVIVLNLGGEEPHFDLHIDFDDIEFEYVAICDNNEKIYDKGE